MNEIEAKRKELEDNYNHTRNNNLQTCYLHELSGFNLGVEMARKEFEKSIDEVLLMIKQYFETIKQSPDMSKPTNESQISSLEEKKQ